MIKQILKYQGNENYICILCLDEKDELFVFYALTGKLSMSYEENDRYESIDSIKYSFNKKCEINIPIIETKNSSLFHLIKIDNEKEYNLICTIVESLT